MIKKILPKDAIHQKILLLVAIFIVTFISAYVGAVIIQSLDSSFQEQIMNTHNHRYIGKLIVRDLIEIEKHVIQLRAVEEEKTLSNISRKVLLLIGNIDEDLVVLKDGGTVTDTLLVNLPHLDKVDDIYQYAPLYDGYNLDVLELRPQLVLIESCFAEITGQINIKIAASDMASKKKAENRVDLFIKQMDTYLLRSLENANKILYDSHAEYNSVVAKQDVFISKVELYVTLLFALITIGLFVLTYQIIKQISQLLIESAASHKKIETLNWEANQIVEVAGPACIINNDRVIYRVNKTFCNFFSMTEDEIVGMKCHDVFKGIFCHSPHCLFMQDEKTGTSSAHVSHEETMERPDGLRHIQIDSYRLEDKEGKMIGLVETIVDITEHKKAEKEMLLLEKELAHAQKLESIGSLAAGVAHEINTPIQFVRDNTCFLQDTYKELLALTGRYMAFVEQVKMKKVTPELIAEQEKIILEADLEYVQEEIPNAVNDSLEGLDRVARIVRAMKEFSHPGNAIKEPANINETIQTTLTVTRNEWKYLAVVETDFDENLPMVPCLINEFNQVILNMIINARDAIAEKKSSETATEDLKQNEWGLITLSTSQEADWAVIKVGDNGAGIPEKVKNRIFDPFFTTKEVGKGSGQGLAIAHNVIVDKHQGKLSVESQPGKGTTFIIRLPMSA